MVSESSTSEGSKVAAVSGGNGAERPGVNDLSSLRADLSMIRERAGQHEGAANAGGIEERHACLRRALELRPALVDQIEPDMHARRVRQDRKRIRRRKRHRIHWRRGRSVRRLHGAGARLCAAAASADPFIYCLNTSTIRGQMLSLPDEIEIAAKAAPTDAGLPCSRWRS